MKQPLPESFRVFQGDYPSIWKSFSDLAQKCHEEGGPLDEKSRRLVKLALAIGARHEGAVHSAVRQALDGGVSKEEMLHVAILGITTLGWPAANAAVTWIRDLAEEPVTSGPG